MSFDRVEHTEPSAIPAQPRTRLSAWIAVKGSQRHLSGNGGSQSLFYAPGPKGPSVKCPPKQDTGNMPDARLDCREQLNFTPDPRLPLLVKVAQQFDDQHEMSRYLDRMFVLRGLVVLIFKRRGSA